jgi:hypothetical protein
MQKQIRQLDFELLPSEESVNSRTIWKVLSKEVEALLEKYPETLDRARGAVLFAEKANGHEESWRDAAYLRGALGEFRSMDEALERDLTAIDLKKSHKLIDSKNPLLHLMKILRDLNFHVKVLQTVKETRNATWDNHSFNLSIAIITGLSAKDLLSTDNAKHYTKSDLDLMVHWFNKAQMQWGAGHIVRLSVEYYARELAVIYM